MAAHFVAFIFLALWISTDCAKILVMVTIGSPSLFNLFSPIIQELVKRNHDVTTQSYFALKPSLKNVKEMIITPPSFIEDQNTTKDFLLRLVEMHPIREVYTYAEFAEQNCAEYLNDETTKTLAAAGKQFDLVLTEAASTCSLAAAALFGKLIVGFCGNGNYPWLYSDVPMPPSYVPNYYTPRSSTMNFWQRMTNAIEFASFQIINNFAIQPETYKALAVHLPEAPSLQEARERVELIITNADPVMYSPRPSMPNVVNCGGLHIRDAKPLSKELQDFVESSGDDGFIIFGLGTNMKSEFLLPKIKKSVLKAFSRLKQKVIWKFEAELKNLPKNVLITKWMPQQDLLGHQKIRLFISHSGLLSMQEAIYHGVPVIGLPFFMDQPGNIGRIEELGVGERLDFFNITADGFYNLIQKVLTDESYSKNAKKYSAIFRDQPVKSIDKAVYWIEYVLRHGGARHLRPAGRDINFGQYFLLDVIGFMLLVVALCVGIIITVAKLILRIFCSKTQHAYSVYKKRK